LRRVWYDTHHVLHTGFSRVQRAILVMFGCTV
jgi:hypothetical protein